MADDSSLTTQEKKLETERKIVPAGHPPGDRPFLSIPWSYPSFQLQSNAPLHSVATRNVLQHSVQFFILSSARGEATLAESLGVGKRLTENWRSRVTRWGAMQRRLKRQVPTLCQVACCSARCVMCGRGLEVGDSRRRTDGVPAELSWRLSRRILL